MLIAQQLLNCRTSHCCLRSLGTAVTSVTVIAVHLGQLWCRSCIRPKIVAMRVQPKMKLALESQTSLSGGGTDPEQGVQNRLAIEASPQAKQGNKLAHEDEVATISSGFNASPALANNVFSETQTAFDKDDFPASVDQNDKSSMLRYLVVSMHRMQRRDQEMADA